MKCSDLPHEYCAKTACVNCPAHNGVDKTEASSVQVDRMVRRGRVGKDELRAVTELATSVKNTKIKLPIRMRDYADSVLRMIETGRI